MKENKRLIILLIILGILIVIAVIVNILLPQEEFTYNFIKGTEWTITDDNESKTIYLYENNDFSYIDNQTGNVVSDFDTCTTYELNSKNIKLNCDKEIKIITTSDTKLYLKINGETKIFTKHEDKNYKIFQVGYLESVNTPVLLSTYEDFITYVDTFSNKFYDGEGNAVSTSTAAIRNQYDSTYFETNNLAIYYVPTNSGSIKIKNVKTIINNTTLEIKYDFVIPEIGTMDMNGFMITVETDKNVTHVK